MVKFIVSVTSFGNRMNNLLPRVLFSLNKQTLQDFRLCLTLNQEDYYAITNPYLKNLITNNEIDLIIADRHLKPHLKYYYAMLKYKDLPIITIDDDTLLPNTAFEELWNSYTYHKNNKVIYARQVIEMHSITSYPSCRQVKNNEKANHRFFAEGFCGILYPPNVFGDSLLDENENKKIASLICDDDVYLKGLEIRKDIKVKRVNRNSRNMIIQLDLGNRLYEKDSLHSKYNSIVVRQNNFNKIRNEMKKAGYKN